MDHRTQQNVDLFLLSEDQFTIVAAYALDGITAVHGSAAFAVFASLLLRSIGTEDDVLRRHAQLFQKTDPELVRRPDVEDLWDAHAKLRAILYYLSVVSCAGSLLCEPCLQRSDRHSLSSRFRL